MKEAKKSFWEKLAFTQNTSCCSPKPETAAKKKEGHVKTTAKLEQHKNTEESKPPQTNCCG